MIDPDYAVPDDAADNPVSSISKSGRPFNLHPISPASTIGYNAPTLEALTFQRTRAKTITSRPRLQQTGTSASTLSMQAPQSAHVNAPQPIVAEVQTKHKALTDAEAQQKRQKSTPAPSSVLTLQGPTTDEVVEDIPSASPVDPSHDLFQTAPSSQVQEIALKQEQDSLDSLFYFAIDISDDDGEEASSSLALGAISVDTYGKLEVLLNLLQQDTAQLVIDSDPARTIFKTLRGQVPADVEEIIFLAVHLESRQLQYQKVVHRIADRAAQAQLKEEMLQLKQTADEKHKNISNLQASKADLEQKILDLSSKRAALLAELEKVETARLRSSKKKTIFLTLSRPFNKNETSKLARPWFSRRNSSL
uniref:DUF1409 domain-containing protein n=1 Tax=Saccharum hybrid cultivar R570 TaxID=131158 RepID=A0A059Q2W4_9POAL|nr:hypothetical protein SHCRBa_015_F23_R_180 [Saccharum hybrid cultivar R570]